MSLLKTCLVIKYHISSCIHSCFESWEWPFWGSWDAQTCYILLPQKNTVPHQGLKPRLFLMIFSFSMTLMSSWFSAKKVKKLLLFRIRVRLSPGRFSPDSSVLDSSVPDTSVPQQFSPRQISPKTFQSQNVQSKNFQSQTVQS